MHISLLRIVNFRNFKSANFKFKSGINTIIGENGAGKTNLFYAFRILLDETLPRYFKFNENDFNRSLQKWAGHWIIISIIFDNLDANEEAQSLAVHSIGNIDTNDKGSYAVYFRPKYQLRKELYEYSIQSDKNLSGLQIILDKVLIDDYETIYLSRGSADFSKKSIYTKYVGDFENIIFPNPDEKEDNIFGAWLPKEINIYNEISCTFIKALRDVEADLKSYTNNPLIKLLKGKEKAVEITQKQEIISSINSLNDQISSLDEIEKIKQGIDNSIKNAVGTTYAPNVDIKSELPNDMDKLFQALKLWVGDPDDDYKGRIWELSLGGANIIYLSLKLLEYEKAKSNAIANFLFIEEPEAHIHTHIQKTLFNNLEESNTQVIISTHSTHISSVSKISSVNILSRDNNKALVFHPSNKLDDNEIMRIERYLDAVRSNLLFAKGVAMVEGDTEQILIPEMFKKVFGITLDEIGVSLINIGSTGFENIAKIFHPSRIRKNCAIITDLDKSIVNLPTDPKDDSDYEKHCRASEQKGNERKSKLTELCNDNKFIKPFYSIHTFEVDFLMNGNSHEYIQCLGNIYKKQNYIDDSTSKLKDNSVEVAGVEVLRLAKKHGKGWLALLVAEELVYNTYIPEYILKSLAFASSHINMSSQAKAIIYRLNQLRSNDKDSAHNEAIQFDECNKSDHELVCEFCSTFKNDQLTRFLSFL